MSEIFVCTYGDALYGDGQYGVCNLRNARSCGPAGADADPITETEAFDPACADEEVC